MSNSSADIELIRQALNCLKNTAMASGNRQLGIDALGAVDYLEHNCRLIDVGLLPWPIEIEQLEHIEQLITLGHIIDRVTEEHQQEVPNKANLEADQI